MFETKAKLSTVDPVWRRVCEEADEAIRSEPLLGGLIHSGLLHHSSLERALAYRFSLKLASGEMSEQILREIADEAYDSAPEIGASARSDLMAVYERDPACHRFLQPILFFKGFQAVQAYRIGHWLWQTGRKDLAYFVQMRVSEVFGVDIHPAARVGKGIMIDHAHSIVIGETAVVGDNVSMLHSVTLGGTGKEDGDRHPKIEDGVLIGAGAKVLGNITVGHWLWRMGRRDMAYFVQMRVSEVFGVDIHPAARVGKGIMIDHAHSIVIGETAVVGDNVSMLHSVTLGGTGKEDGDRHPKIEDGVLIGAGAKVLGNIRVGHCSRIAAGSVVLQDVPCNTTVAGVPARVVGKAGCDQPALTMDQILKPE